MEKKLIDRSADFKLTGDAGQFQATFSLFNNKDLDNDVTLPGAFQEGEQVRLAQYGHNWNAPPIGRGVIHSDDVKAWIDGEFFLNTQAGKDTYESIKALSDLQQWSYGFSVKDSIHGEFNGDQVRFLKSLEVFEVSPVMLGAQPLTATEFIKEAKAGARNAAADMKRLQAIHETLVELGVKCSGDEPKGKAEDPAEGKAEDPPAGFWAERAALEILELV